MICDQRVESWCPLIMRCYCALFTHYSMLPDQLGSWSHIGEVFRITSSLTMDTRAGDFLTSFCCSCCELKQHPSSRSDAPSRVPNSSLRHLSIVSCNFALGQVADLKADSFVDDIVAQTLYPSD